MNTLGLVLVVVVVTAASVQDREGAKLGLQALSDSCKQVRLVWVDGGYRGGLPDWVLERFKFVLEVVLRSNTAQGFGLLPRRRVVERAFLIFMPILWPDKFRGRRDDLVATGVNQYRCHYRVRITGLAVSEMKSIERHPRPTVIGDLSRAREIGT